MTRSRRVFVNAATWESRTLQNWISYQNKVLDLEIVTSREKRPTKLREPQFKKQLIVTSHDFIHRVNRTVATLLTARENAASDCRYRHNELLFARETINPLYYFLRIRWLLASSPQLKHISFSYLKNIDRDLL